MKTWSMLALGLLLVGSPARAQTSSPNSPSDFEKMLAGTSVLKINGSCKRLETPDGDQTSNCENQLINVAFSSGNSSFAATIKGRGGVTFRGKDSAARGDVAAIELATILVTGTDLSTPPVVLKAKGRCTYTNPNKGPIQVECWADTVKGKYTLSYVSDGVWPPK